MRRSWILAAALAACTLVAVPDARAEAVATATDVTITSFDGTQIALTVFRPAEASPSARVPAVLDSHGWAGSRRTSLDDPVVAAFLAAGYGVVSFDQRGHGDSGGQANVQDPDLEVRDTEAVIDVVAGLDWVAQEAPGDPLLGAIGGSYGGAYQTMTALAEQEARPGGTRFDVLAPQITWHDLPDSLAPSDVPRTAWLAALYSAGADMLPPYVHQAFVEGFATGSLPASIKKEFATHSPRWYTDRGVRLDIPVLFRQGASDNLFNLNQGLANFEHMLSPRAKQASRFIAFNGGHALPGILPPGSIDGTAVSPDGEVDACSGDGGFLARTIEFFDAALRGRGATALDARYSLTTNDGARCLRIASLPRPVSIPVPTTITTAAAGAPQYVPVHRGPLTVAGVPHLRAAATTFTPDTRVFVGLAVGTSPADARIVQNNVMPLRLADIARGKAVDLALAGVAVEVPAGQTLYLVVTPVDTLFAAHGSRVPGAAILSRAVLDLPIVSR
jgi:ABC-2 type transport system ATP-binding protein